MRTPLLKDFNINDMPELMEGNSLSTSAHHTPVMQQYTIASNQKCFCTSLCSKSRLISFKHSFYKADSNNVYRRASPK